MATESTPGDVRERTKQLVVTLAKPLRQVASVLEALAMLGAIGGVVGGIAIAAHSDIGIDGSTHPWVGAGLGVIAAAIIAGVFNWALARALQLFAVDVAARHGGILDDVPPPAPTTD
jgi:hypothetical protein